MGKLYGCHALSQEEMNGLIVEYAQKHKRIVRLKGGDPFVYGRAQEEIQEALNNGMDVEIIPGISSALAVPAMEMIPLTARGVNESFWVTTGTTQYGKISADIKLAAQSSATVIILMAMSKLEEIMELFATQGKANTPVAIIENGTTTKSKMVIGRVRDIFCKAQFEGLSNPAVIVVGEVVKRRAEILKDVSKKYGQAIKESIVAGEILKP